MEKTTRWVALDVHAETIAVAVVEVEGTVRSLGTIWALIHPGSLAAAKSWVQNHAAFMAHGVYSFLALPGWAATGVLGVILAFLFGRRLGPE